MNTKHTSLGHYAAIIALITFAGAVQAEPDWSALEPLKVTAIYPGVASWQYLNSEDHGKGEKSVSKNKKSCAKCHISKKGEYEILADEIVTGELTKSISEESFEPTPHEGLEGFMDLSVQAAYDPSNIYLKITWPSVGTSFNDATVAAAGKADRVSIQMANDNIKNFENYGCFIACHDDMKDMPKDAGKKLYAEFASKKGKMLPDAVLDKLKGKGMLIDQWVAGFHGNEVKVTDEFILSERSTDNADVKATGTYADGNYSIVFSRPLTTDDAGDVALADGGMVSISIAIHDNKSDSRFHYTSFPVSVGLGGKNADLVATKL